MLNKHIRFEETILEEIGYGRVVGITKDKDYLIEIDKRRGDIEGWKYDDNDSIEKQGIVFADGYKIDKDKTYYVIPIEKVYWLDVEQIEEEQNGNSKIS